MKKFTPKTNTKCVPSKGKLKKLSKENCKLCYNQEQVPLLTMFRNISSLVYMKVDNIL